ncbi:MAG TPA: DUF892 family protein [Bryobacteraceae bacterium]
MNTESLQELLIDDLRDIYDAEKQLTKALPKVAEAASNEQLAKGIQDHLEETKKQIQRLEEAFKLLNREAESEPCAGMKGIVQEGSEHLAKEHPRELTDTIIIAGGRKMEHYEIVSYTGAIELTLAIGNAKVARLLKQTLAEEERMDKKLAAISARLLKPSTARKTSRAAG